MSETEDLWRNFEKASKELKYCAGGKPGFSAEKKYGQAYMALVKAGEAPRLKQKYRGGVK